MRRLASPAQASIPERLADAVGPVFARQAAILLVDGTGIKSQGGGEWQARKHGT